MINQPKDLTRRLTLEKCDVLKVFMMITVLVYHCVLLWGRGGWFNQAPTNSSSVLSILSAYLYTFPIYVFVFVSGYLFYYLKFEIKKYRSFNKDIIKRAKRLLLPYIIVSALWVIPFNIYFFDNFSLTSIFKKFILAQGPAQLWFLVMLFGLFGIFYLLSNFFEKNNFFVCLAFCGIIYCIGILSFAVLDNSLQLGRIGEMFVFYFMGFYFRKKQENFFYKIPTIIYFILSILFFSFNYFYLSGKEGVIYSLLNNITSLICSLMGTVFFVVLFSEFSWSTIQKNKFFLFLKKHSFVMYMIHQQLIYITISLFNSSLGTMSLVIVNIIFSFVGSALISVLISKTPKINKLFGY